MRYTVTMWSSTAQHTQPLILQSHTKMRRTRGTRSAPRTWHGRQRRPEHCLCSRPPITCLMGKEPPPTGKPTPRDHCRHTDGQKKPVKSSLVGSIVTARTLCAPRGCTANTAATLRVPCSPSRHRDSRGRWLTIRSANQRSPPILPHSLSHSLMPARHRAFITQRTQARRRGMTLVALSSPHTARIPSSFHPHQPTPVPVRHRAHTTRCSVTARGSPRDCPPHAVGRLPLRMLRRGASSPSNTLLGECPLKDRKLGHTDEPARCGGREDRFSGWTLA